jgi:hypothetical protein
LRHRYTGPGTDVGQSGRCDQSVRSPTSADPFLSFSLSDPEQLELLFSKAGFREGRVASVRREDTIGSFDEYWLPIEAGIGSIAKVYFTLTEANRRAVRDEVRARLAPYELPDGKLHMGIEMLIDSGRA